MRSSYGGDEFGGHGLGDAAAGAEGGDDLHVARLRDRGQVVEDRVGDVLVEDAFVAEALQVELEALELDAELVRECSVIVIVP